MNRFISTFTLAGLSTVAGMLALSTGVNAQTVNSGEVKMTATIGTFCIFENPLDGTLGVPTDNLAILDSTQAANNIATLDGAAGSIDVTCNDANATVNISSVTETNTANATLNTSTTTVSGLETDIVSTDGAAGTAVRVGSTNTETLSVNLASTYGSNITKGDYTFTVNLEATP